MMFREYTVQQIENGWLLTVVTSKNLSVVKHYCPTEEEAWDKLASLAIDRKLKMAQEEKS